MPPTTVQRDVAVKNRATIATVERAADILLYLAEAAGPDFGITEIADALQVPKAAVHRVLASLRGRGLVELDERTRRYSLGVGSLRLGLAYLDRIDVRRMGRPALEELSARTGETATLSVLLGGRERIYVDQVCPDREVIMSVSLGEPHPLHAGASSRAFLAYLPEEQVEKYIEEQPLASLTGRTITEPAKLRENLQEIRDRGWASSSGERKGGAASVAAPVRSHDGYPVAVVSVCGPVERFNAELEACRDALLETARTLSRQFGWNG